MDIFSFLPANFFNSYRVEQAADYIAAWVMMLLLARGLDGTVC